MAIHIHHAISIFSFLISDRWSLPFGFGMWFSTRDHNLYFDMFYSTFVFCYFVLMREYWDRDVMNMQRWVSAQKKTMSFWGRSVWLQKILVGSSMESGRQLAQLSLLSILQTIRFVWIAVGAHVSLLKVWSFCKKKIKIWFGFNHTNPESQLFIISCALGCQEIAKVTEVSIGDYEEGLRACSEASKTWKSVSSLHFFMALES